ncbi:MAG: hypothetical protein JOZ05_23650 [Acetobacteraceae bacterium]|nr:hypothetical protein [Acetobacteraceae bacterium]
MGQSCRADDEANCASVPPGGGRAVRCLREHAAQLSPECQDCLASLRR